MKIVALVVSAVLLCAWVGLTASSASSPKPLPVDPAALYQTYNELYFNNELPKDVEVVGQEAPDTAPGHFFYAETSHAAGTHWYKMFISPKYNIAIDQEEEAILHESCHIKMWEVNEAEGIPYDGGHGPEWQACMLDLAKQNAFHDIW